MKNDHDDIFDRLAEDIDNAPVKEYEFGDIIREIPVDLITTKLKNSFKARACIMQDTSNPVLVGTLVDKETKEEYHYSFNANWLSNENADWLSGVVCRLMGDTVYQTKRNYKNQLNTCLKNLGALSGIRVYHE